MADNLQLELEIKGVEQVKRMLTNIGLDMKDLKGAMTDVGEYAKKYFGGQVFAPCGGVLGKSWPRLTDDSTPWGLSPGYAAHKAKRYASRPVLVRTGVMQRSFVPSPSSMSVTITSEAPWFNYHQSSAPRTKIPHRVMIGVYTGMRDHVTNIIPAALSKKIQSRAG